jgi:hypothetical protein
MHFLKELEITLGGDLFFFLPGFHNAFLYMYNRHQRVSPAVKVYVIQQLCLHFRSHMAVFQKMVIFHKEIFRVLFNSIVPRYCQMASVRSDSLPPSLSEGKDQVCALVPSSRAPLHCLFVQMPLLSEPEDDSTQARNRGRRQRVQARPEFAIDVSSGSYYHRLLAISYNCYCYSTGKSLRDGALFPAFQWLCREHIWLYECCLQQSEEKIIHRDRLIPKREMGYSLKVLAGLYPTREDTPEGNGITIGKRVLSNIMAYRAAYFGCECLEDFEFFETAEQLLAKMSSWEVRNHQGARLNGYGYGSMFPISQVDHYANVYSYFNLVGINLGNNFASEPPSWSSIRSIIVSTKHPERTADHWFPNCKRRSHRGTDR